jgi:hypothetical protein
MLLFHASLVQHDRAPFEGAKMGDGWAPRARLRERDEARIVRFKRG